MIYTLRNLCRALITTSICISLLACSDGDNNQASSNTILNPELSPMSENNNNSDENIFVSTASADNNPSVIKKNNAILDYKQARPVFWKKLYNQGGSTLYCGQDFDGIYNRDINIEHIFPMSWATNSLQCGTRKECRRNSNLFNEIESDLHNLYPSKTHINDARSSIAFGMVSGEKREFGTCDFEVSNNPRLVEPRASVRGEIARSMFYMVHQYEDLSLFKKQIKTLKAWHNQDPVSKEERRRNDIIEELQGNRNPFIDNPDLINSLY